MPTKEEPTPEFDQVVEEQGDPAEITTRPKWTIAQAEKEPAEEELEES